MRKLDLVSVSVREKDFTERERERAVLSADTILKCVDFQLFSEKLSGIPEDTQTHSYIHTHTFI